MRTLSEKRWSGLTIVIGAALSALACAVESPTEGAGGAESADAGTGGGGDVGAGFEIEGGPSPGGSFGTGGVGVELEVPDQCAEIRPISEAEGGNCWDREDLELGCFAPEALRSGRGLVYLWRAHSGGGELTSHRSCGDGGSALCPSADELYFTDRGGCGGPTVIPACDNPTIEREGLCCYRFALRQLLC